MKRSKGIFNALLNHAFDEGRQDALRIAEEWHTKLEAMIEVANDEEQAALKVLLGPLTAAINELV